jgi:hypothetical protein
MSDFTKIQDTNVEYAYDVISTMLNSSVRCSQYEECVLNFEISDKINKEDLFLTIVGDYEAVGYDVRITDDLVKNRYSVKLNWVNYIQPEDEYNQLMNYINSGDFVISKLRRMPSQLSSFPDYRDSTESIIEFIYIGIKKYISALLKFIWISA